MIVCQRAQYVAHASCKCSTENAGSPLYAGSPSQSRMFSRPRSVNISRPTLMVARLSEVVTTWLKAEAKRSASIIGTRNGELPV